MYIVHRNYNAVSKVNASDASKNKTACISPDRTHRTHGMHRTQLEQHGQIEIGIEFWTRRNTVCLCMGTST